MFWKTIYDNMAIRCNIIVFYQCEEMDLVKKYKLLQSLQSFFIQFFY